MLTSRYILTGSKLLRSSSTTQCLNNNSNGLYNTGVTSLFSTSSSLYNTQSRSFAKKQDGEGDAKSKGKGKKDDGKQKQEAVETKKGGKKVDQRKLLKPKTDQYNFKDTTTVLVTKQHSTTNQLDRSILNENVSVITREELKSLLQNPEELSKYTIVDLRSPREFFGDSPLEQSQNMPMDVVAKQVELDEEQLEKQRIREQNKRGKSKENKKDKKKASADDDLNFWERSNKLTAAQWKDKFGFNKFALNDGIIFYSANNGRSVDCANMAAESGYTNVKVLEGGVRQWNKFESRDQPQTTNQN